MAKTTININLPSQAQLEALMSNLTKLAELIPAQAAEIAALRALAGKLGGEQAILLDRISALTDELAAAQAGSAPVPDALVAAAEDNSRVLADTKRALQVMDELVVDAVP